MKTTTRRGLLGAIAVSPIALVATPASAAITGSDPQWAALVTDFRRTHAAFIATSDFEDRYDEAFERACATLPPKPKDPGSGLPGDILHMTLRQIRAAGDDPAHKAAWATYERNLADWQSQRDALHARIFGPPEALNAANWAAFTGALEALAHYRVKSLSDLGEKLAIIAADYKGSDIPQEYLGAILTDVRHLSERS